MFYTIFSPKGPLYFCIGFIGLWTALIVIKDIAFFFSLPTENLEVQRWLFKLDVEFDSRGTSYCDVPTHLKCYDWCVKEAQRYGAKWSKKWAQEPAYRKILAELPEIIANHSIPINTDVYPTWQVSK